MCIYPERASQSSINQTVEFLPLRADPLKGFFMAFVYHQVVVTFIYLCSVVKESDPAVKGILWTRIGLGLVH